jgi:hypothetical protein
MPRFLLIALSFCLFATVADAIPDPRSMQFPGGGPGGFPGGFLRGGQSPGEQCRAAIGAAERGHGIPPQLLASIGRVESGRRDPSTGMWGAWPWTINSEGQGSYFESKADAISAVMALQARGVRSIDVGCMQVNLMHHPTAFASLDMAFEPAVNADYAARFLVQLNGQSADWTKATASYHSANPWEGGPYAAKVNSIWPEEQRKASAAPPLQLAPSGGASGRAQFAAAAVAPYGSRQPPRMIPLSSTTGGMARGMIPAAGIASSSLSMPGSALASPLGLAAMAPGMRLPAGALPRTGTNPMGAMQPASQSAGASLAVLLPLGTTGASNGAAPGQIIPSVMLNSSMPGQNGTSPGRGLAFYRAAPVMKAIPVQTTTRVPYRLSMR